MDRRMGVVCIHIVDSERLVPACRNRPGLVTRSLQTFGMWQSIRATSIHTVPLDYRALRHVFDLETLRLYDLGCRLRLVRVDRAH
jgi:hypothetical protein